MNKTRIWQVKELIYYTGFPKGYFFESFKYDYLTAKHLPPPTPESFFQLSKDQEENKIHNDVIIKNF